MTEQLHQRLADLAGDVATPAPADPAGLWRAGKRRQRRRTTAGAVAACALVLAGVSGAGLLLPSAGLTTGPSATRTAPALPDRLYVPGRWLESNDDDPVGPFAAVLTAGQGWSGTTAYIGVSATTAEYRRFDLPGGLGPGADEGFTSAYALSPSGRYVAYWHAEKGARPDAESGRRPLDGVALYDTVSGAVSRQDLPAAPHGWAGWDLRWLDDTRLYLQAGKILGAPGTDDASASRTAGGGWLWGVRAKALTPFTVPGVPKIESVDASDAQGHLLVDPKGPGPQLLLDPARPAQQREVLLDWGAGLQVTAEYRLSRDGHVAAAATDLDGENPALVIGAPDGSRRVLDRVPAWDVYGWSDGWHVVAAVSRPSGPESSTAEIVEVDTRTGKAQRFISLPERNLNPPDLAEGLLAVPPVHRGEPDWPTDPRVFIGLGVGAAVLLLAALRIWRRREQR